MERGNKNDNGALIYVWPDVNATCISLQERVVTSIDPIAIRLSNVIANTQSRLFYHEVVTTRNRSSFTNCLAIVFNGG